uniref:Uncharacterized protein n=1 Tax=Angiostrongylus cantonensis TaxID=6313 RepID=A0A0K0CXV9_ANGCA
MFSIRVVLPLLDLNRCNNEHPHRDNDQLWAINWDQHCSEEGEGAKTLGEQKFSYQPHVPAEFTTGDTFRIVEDVVGNHDDVVASVDVAVVDVGGVVVSVEVVVVDVDDVVVTVDVVTMDVNDVVTSDGVISASLRSTLLPTDGDLTLPRGITSGCTAFRGGLDILRGVVVVVGGCTTDAIDGTLI